MGVPRFVRFLSTILLAMLVFGAAAQSVSGDGELVLGVQAYKQAKYEEAIQHFEKAVEQDPANVKARLYLATAYAQQYIPGAETSDNIEMAQRAIAQYKQVIDFDPSKASLTAVKGIAYLDLQMKKFDEAKDYYRRATDLDPEDPESFYSIGVIDWTLSYVSRQDERAKLGLRPDDSLTKNKEACARLRAKNWTAIDDGIENLSKALQLRPDYDDAMAYMNLMYRERADVQCDDPGAHRADLKTADNWVDKTMGTKKIKAEAAEKQTAPKPE
jgi:tetratricopeptide (TPR) repeat protein